MADLTLTEIGVRINKHLKRFEADPKINAVRESHHNTSPYYSAGAWRAGRYVCVIYISYQGNSSLTKEEALQYLAWLDKGNVGHHFEALR